uniref:hypothetical protein n=1 Tax=Thaumasiovibrio occultus TaxID=1891184 RepID=UPI000B3550E4|nr:hypothetical protein [Thaumasiovibrio occultus]
MAWLLEVTVLVGLYLGVIEPIKYQQRLLEKKITLLVEKTGIDPHFAISDEIKSALQAGERITALRLYRKETGASLREARRVIDALSSELAES